MKKGILLLLGILAITSGCAIHAVDVKTITIPPRNEPVTITAQGVATCTDFFLFYQVKEQLAVKSSDGQKAESLNR